MSGVEVVDGHYDTDATTVVIPANELTTFRIKAPADAPTEPGEWIPLSGGGSAISETAEWWAGSLYVYGEGTDPDVVAATEGADDDDWWPATWLEYTLQNGVNELYCEIPVITYSASMFGTASEIPSAGPNAFGPEFQVGTSPPVWHIRGRLNARAMLHEDPTALQLEDYQLVFARVPHELVVETGEADSAYPGTQWRWSAWPDRATLASLEVIHTAPVPAIDDYVWVDYSGYMYEEGSVPFSLDLEIETSWIVDGRAHITFWYQRISDPDLAPSCTYTGSRSIVGTPTTDTAPEGPIANSFALSSTGNLAGAFSAASDHGVYCSSFTAASGGVLFYPYGSVYNGRTGVRNSTKSWMWLAVANNNFGMCVLAVPWSTLVVVTPDGVWKYTGGLSELQVAHSTPFTAGDTAEVTVDGSGLVTVRRNGVVVSTCTPVGEWTNTDYYCGQYAREVNAGNRLSGLTQVTEPTHDGMIVLYAEMDYESEPSVFEGAPPTAYRHNHAIGYPKFFLERYDYSLQPPEWTCWLRLQGPTDTSRLWMGWLNSEFGVVDPAEFVDQYTPGWARVNERPDGTAYESDWGSSAYHSRGWSMDLLPDVTPRTGGTSPVYGDRFEMPDEEMIISNLMPTYLRIKATSGYASTPPPDEKWCSLQFLANPMGGLDYAPRVWHWQPGDDHDGFQNIGYQHATTPMKVGPSKLVKGMAMQFQSSIEEWLYNGREGVIGYNDDEGPFFYGWLAPYGAGFEIFDDDTIYSYDHGQGAGSRGEVFGRLLWGGYWSNQIYGTGYDEEYGQMYHDLYGYPLHGIDYRLVGDEHAEFHGLPRTGYYATQFGRVIETAAPYSWSWYDTEWENTFVLHLKAYPDSVFIQWIRAYPQGMRSKNQIKTVRVNKSTFEVEQEYNAFDLIADYAYQKWIVARGLSYALVTPDQERICFAHMGQSGSTTALLVVNNVFNIECNYGTAYPANAYTKIYEGDNAVLTAEAAGSDVWLRATPSGAGNYGMSSRTYYSPLEGMDGVTLQGQTLIRRPGTLSAQLGVEFFDEARSSLGVQWGPLTSGGAGDSTLGGMFTPPAGTFWVVMKARATGGASFSIKHPGLWEPGVGVGTYGSVPYSIGTHYLEWDPASDSFTVNQASEELHSDQFMAHTSSGRIVVGYTTYQSLWDPATDVDLRVELEPYQGKGFNGGFLGTDGRYLYEYQLNYHVEPSAYILTDDDIAKIDPAATGAWQTAGTTVSVGGGIAQAFNEIYRYDLQDLVFYPSAPYEIAYFIYDMAVGFNPGTGEGIYYSFISGVETNYRPDLFTATISGDDLSIGSHAPYTVHIANAGPSGYAGTVACFIHPYTGQVAFQLWSSYMTYGGADYDIVHADPVTWWDETDEGFPLMAPAGAGAQPGSDRYATFNPDGPGAYWLSGDNGGTVTSAGHAECAFDYYHMQSRTGADADYGIRHGPLPSSEVTSLDTLWIQVTMNSLNGAAYARIRVTFCDENDNVLDVYEGAEQQYLITQGFAEDIEFQCENLSWADHFYVDLIWRWIETGFYSAEQYALGSGHQHPYGLFSNLTVKNGDGTLPIEYLFNHDSPLAQTYCNVVEPRYEITPGNKLLPKQWRPTVDTSGFTWSARNGGTISITATANGLLIDPGTETEVWIYTKPVWANTWMYGLQDTWRAGVRMFTQSGAVDGTNATISMVLYDALDNIITELPSSGGSWLNGSFFTTPPGGWFRTAYTYPYNYPYAYSSVAVKIGVKLRVAQMTDSLLVYADHWNLIPEDSVGSDIDPAVGDAKSKPAGGSGWEDVGAGGINYDFSWWGWPQTFAPGGKFYFGNEFTAGLRKPPSQRNPEHADQRQHRAIQSMLPGSMGGRVANAEPSRATSAVAGATSGGAGTAPLELVASFSGDLVAGTASEPLRVVQESVVAKSVYATLGDIGLTNTVVTVTKNGTTIATLTINANEALASAAIAEALVATDAIRFIVTTAGADAGNLTVQLRS